MDTEKILEQLGFSSKEIRVYKALLQTGIANAAKIAKQASLPRQTTYSLLASMVEKRFVEQSDKRGVRQYFADPDELLKLIAQKRDALEKQKKILEVELPKLIPQRKQTSALPKVQYYEGIVGLERLFEHMLEQHKSKVKTFRGLGINTLNADPGFGDYLRSFLERRHKYGVTTNLLVANAPDNFEIKDTKTALGRNVKRLDVEEQEAGIYFVGNCAYFFSYRDNVGVMIENQAIVTYLKDAFDILWDKTHD